MKNWTDHAKTKAARFVIAVVFLLIPLSAHCRHEVPFAIISDTHIRTGNNTVYPFFLQKMEKRKIHNIIHLGDVIDTPGKAGQWARFLKLTGNKRLHLVPGNHDIRDEQSLGAYLRLFKKPYYSLSDGDTLFVFLNTELPETDAAIDGAQLAWLKSELGKSFRYKFVFLHRPLYPLLLGHGLDRHMEARDNLHHLFVMKGVSLVVSGHEHIYGRLAKDGILYVTASTLGGWLPPTMKDREVFRYISATKNSGGYIFTVRDMEDNIKDRFTVYR